MLGIGTVLVRVPSADVIDASLNDDHDRLIALLAVATRGRVPTGLAGHLEAAAKHWRRGDKALAHIRLAFARIPRLDSEDDAYRLFLAEELFAAGYEADYLLKELSLPATQIGLLKHPGQARVPKGNGSASGEFGSGTQEVLAPTPVFLEMPFELPLQPLEPVIPFGARPGTPVGPLPPIAPAPGLLPNPDKAGPTKISGPKQT